MNFLKNILSTIVALIIFSLAALFIGIGVLSAITASEKFVVEPNSVLHLKFNKPITELEVDNPLEEFGAFGGQSSSIGLVELKEAINNAATDDNIKGIYLDLNYFMGGMASLEEVRAVLQQFKDSGKFIYAYAEYFSEGGYYLASIADKVFLNPEGEVELNGLSANVTFFQGTLEKFGVEAQIFRVGEYKSAVEPFLRKDLSKENELQLNELLNDMNANMLKSISKSRHMEFTKLKDISDKMKVREADDAITHGLVDELLYEDQVLELLNEAANEDINLVKYGNYKSSFSNYKSSKNKIAVIVASGDIVMGRGEDGNVGGTKFAKLIRDARLDNSVKAIVVRVNSPGGAYLASDVMWREIDLASKSKPVIASMSDYAASGGYYLAMSCDTIVAQPNTITGSIGIFGMLFNFDEFLEQRLGITHDEVKTGEFSSIINVTRSLTDSEKEIIQKSLEKNYDTFISKAAEGRGMSKEDLLVVASGRVWTGNQALEKGLVDILGSYQDAIDIAADKAGVTDDYKLKYYPEPKPFIEKLMEDFGAETRASFVKNDIGDLYPYLQKVKDLKKLQGSQARVPFEIEIN